MSRSVVMTAGAVGFIIWQSRGNHRGRGIAKLLIEECIAGLRTTGIKRAIILVAADNPQGHQFWVRNGWEDIPGALPMTREV